MVPKLTNSTSTLAVFVATIVAIRRDVCNRVFPSGGSNVPIVVGIKL
jgi:hypothetical protein